eukprot:scaffold7405_cov15-Prasinocladus_malaysianus.AAC.1
MFSDLSAYPISSAPSRWSDNPCVSVQVARPRSSGVPVGLLSPSSGLVRVWQKRTRSDEKVRSPESTAKVQ